MNKRTRDPLDVLDDLSHEVGLEAAERDVTLKREELAEIDAIILAARRQLAHQARADVVDPTRPPRPVRASIVVMARSAILVRLNELRTQAGVQTLAMSHHQFGGHASDEELRAALEDLETCLDEARDGS